MKIIYEEGGGGGGDGYEGGVGGRVFDAANSSLLDNKVHYYQYSNTHTHTAAPSLLQRNTSHILSSQQSSPKGICMLIPSYNEGLVAVFFMEEITLRDDRQPLNTNLTIPQHIPTSHYASGKIYRSGFGIQHMLLCAQTCSKRVSNPLDLKMLFLQYDYNSLEISAHNSLNFIGPYIKIQSRSFILHGVLYDEVNVVVNHIEQR
ncbi:hypothetical protein FF38_11482 [Lucilia cuprina]|uniref:Uncharacterized protein n=1 Tax=Lucilia cuprina TaxID=7375 RepID=A0A0L0CP13_LUCCU|nr:hypothetical protein FF38_11482 [Lucilia cuprina]